jgi:hypothetical protein
MKVRLGMLLALVTVPMAYADIFSFAMPAGSTIGGRPVSASALIVTEPGFISITLTDLQANPTNVAQLISDFDFTLSDGATTGTLVSQAGTLVSIDKGGTSNPVSGIATGWQSNSDVSGGIQISAIGGGQPKNLIIGPGGAGGIYTNANGSISGNPAHNPFIDGTGLFTVIIPSVTADTQVLSAAFSFGDASELDVTNSDAGASNAAFSSDAALGVDVTSLDPSPVPEPASMLLLASTLGALLLGFRKRLTSR